MILKAGPFNILYEKGFLRYIKNGNLEIVRMIYFALRDENWGTYELFVENEEIESNDSGFTIHYDAYNQKNNQPVFKWRVLITGDTSGEIKFTVHGEALEDILKNRAGLCVLHPIKETAGATCEITHSDGSILNSHFPKWIAPQNPFTDVRAMKWECEGHRFMLTFGGDVFETEDQRNWTDASFKTFCTPLHLPFPVALKKHNQVFQSVLFQPCDTKIPRLSTPLQSMDMTTEKFALPEIGIGASTETDTLPPHVIELIRALNLSHYRIEVSPGRHNWVGKFLIDCDHAEKLHLPLEVALHLTDNFKAEVEEFTEQHGRVNTAIKKILLLSHYSHTTNQPIVNYAAALRRYFPGVKIGAGTDFNFTELNRNHFDASPLDFVSYSIHPQEHAFDDLSLMETIEAHADTVASAKNIYPHHEIHLSPITLKKRFNPYAKLAADAVMTNEQKADPRQREVFCAEWTQQCIHELSRAGAGCITLHQTYGQQGLCNGADVYPVYATLKEILKTLR